MTTQMSFPDWLGASTSEMLQPPAHTPSGRRSTGFVEKTLIGLASIVQDSLYAEKTAQQAGWLQTLDPRVKTISTLLLILSTNLTANGSHLLALYGLVLIGAWASKIAWRVILWRVWLLVLAFSTIALLPALLNTVSPGPTWIQFYSVPHPLQAGFLTLPPSLSITTTGLDIVSRLFLRALLSVSFALLLTLTTRWHTLFQAFYWLRVPRLFISIAEMTIRYIHVLLALATDMFLARKSRTVGRTAYKQDRLFVMRSIGALFAHSLTLSNDVYAAMRSRGYTGIPRSSVTWSVSKRDWVCLLICLIIIYATNFLQM